MATVGEKMTAIANAIRKKTGGTAKLTLDTMASSLNNIPERTSSNLSASGATVTVPAGNYKTQATKSVATATQATPSISVNSSGLITASAKQTAGYVAAGTKSATKQLTTKAATTITPGTRNQTVAAGTYLTGALTIAGDADLIPANIASGKNIFGVTGTHTSGVELNFTVVGGTTQPSSPAANTIWVNTSTSITSWVFSATQPTSPANGMVWFKTGTSCDVTFNALKTNNITVYPLACKQYVSSAWVDKVAKIYKNSAWQELWSGQLFINGNQYTHITGGWQKRQDRGNWTDVDLSESTISVHYSAKRDYGISAYVRTKNLIDVTNYNELSIVLGEFSEQFKLSLIDNNENEVASVTPTVTGTVRLSLADITGSYYINLYVYGHDHGTEGDSYATAKFTVSEVKLS